MNIILWFSYSVIYVFLGFTFNREGLKKREVRFVFKIGYLELECHVLFLICRRYKEKVMVYASVSDNKVLNKFEKF